MLKGIRDQIQSGAEANNLGSLVQIGGNSLLKDGKFGDNPDKTARHLILPLIKAAA